MSEQRREISLAHAVVIGAVALASGGVGGSALSGSAEARAIGAEVRAMEAKLSGKLDVLTAQGADQGRRIDRAETAAREQDRAIVELQKEVALLKQQGRTR